MAATFFGEGFAATFLAGLAIVFFGGAAFFAGSFFCPLRVDIAECAVDELQRKCSGDHMHQQPVGVKAELVDAYPQNYGVPFAEE